MTDNEPNFQTRRLLFSRLSHHAGQAVCPINPFIKE